MNVSSRRQINIFWSKRAIIYVVLEVETAEEKKLIFLLLKTITDVVFLYENGMKQKQIFLSRRAVIYVVFEVEPVNQIKLTFPLWQTVIYVTFLHDSY